MAFYSLESYADFAMLAIPANPRNKRARHLWLAYRIWLMFLDFVMAKEYLALYCQEFDR